MSSWTSSTSTGVGYAQEMASRPQTLYGIGDSPVGLAAWLSTTTRAVTRSSRASLTVSVRGLRETTSSTTSRSYWLTNTAVSSARIYWENKFAFFAPKHVAIPVAVSAFPDEVCSNPAELGRRRPTQSSYYYNRPREGWALRRLGSSRKLFAKEVSAGVQVAALCWARAAFHGRRPLANVRFPPIPDISAMAAFDPCRLQEAGGWSPSAEVQIASGVDVDVRPIEKPKFAGQLDAFFQCGPPLTEWTYWLMPPIEGDVPRTAV